MDGRRIGKDLAAGLLFLGLAALFAADASKLPLGTSLRIGPGVFPLLLSTLLGALGLALVVTGLRSPADADWTFAWRGLVLIVVAVVAFGFLVQPLGFLLAVAITAAIAIAASPQMSILRALLLTAALVGFCWAVFIAGIKISWPLIGPWLDFLRV